MSLPRSEERLRELRRRVLAWYRNHARDLPWRRTRDPYAIWISEVMLQQTRVDTVRPFYERFLERWPTVAALAAADPDEVRSAWSGLGYYRRARSMLDAAQVIVERHGGELPADPDALSALPGFGPYTTGAVASIAFDRPVPAVDGNVARVLARCFALEGDVSKGAPAREVRALAARLAPGEAPGDLTQALIELGALICKRSPACGRCPARELCAARIEGRTSVIPPPRKRAEQRTTPLTALVLASDAGILLAPRPEGGLFGGMWCPPLLEGHLAETEASAAWGALEVSLETAGEVRHLLTHRRLVARVLRGAPPARLPPGARLVDPERLFELGLPSFAVKLLRTGLQAHQLPAELPGRRTAGGAQLEIFDAGPSR